MNKTDAHTIENQNIRLKRLGISPFLKRWMIFSFIINLLPLFLIIQEWDKLPFSTPHSKIQPFQNEKIDISNLPDELKPTPPLKENDKNYQPHKAQSLAVLHENKVEGSQAQKTTKYTEIAELKEKNNDFIDKISDVMELQSEKPVSDTENERPLKAHKPIIPDEYEVEDVLTSKGGETVKEGSNEPRFPGGIESMQAFLAQEITYPEQAFDEKVQGSVVIKISVDETGKITSSEIVKGIGGGCDEEVLDAIGKMPHWKPALENGKPVKKSFSISVAFNLDEE